MRYLNSINKITLALFLALLCAPSLFASDVGTEATDGTKVPDGEIPGLWLRGVENDIGGAGGREGFYLHEDGTLELVGIASMNGLNWKVEGKELILTTNTDRYREPVEVKYTIEKLTDKTLAIKSDDYLSGKYEREAPGSSAALKEWRDTVFRMYIDNVKEYMKYVDGNSGKYKKEEKTLEPEKEGWGRRKLVLWTEDGQPVRLTFSEPDDAGRMDLGSAVYYLDGEVYFFKGPFSGHVFKNGRQVLWVDENMKPLTSITQKDLKASGQTIEKRSGEYLGQFNTGN